MIEWGALAAVGALCGGASAVVTVLLTKSRFDREAVRKQGADEERARILLEKVPLIEATMNKHLLDCADENGRVRTTLQNVDSSLRQLTKMVERVTGHSVQEP
jgi:hypothetical protein